MPKYYVEVTVIREKHEVYRVVIDSESREKAVRAGEVLSPAKLALLGTLSEVRDGEYTSEQHGRILAEINEESK